MVFKVMSFKVLSNFPIVFNGFQNNVFQSVLKNLHRFQWFSNYVLHKIMCLQSVFKFPHRIQRVFKLCTSKCFQMSHSFQWFSNYVFQNFPIGFNGFKFPHRFQWFSKLCVSKCFQISP